MKMKKLLAITLIAATCLTAAYEKASALVLSSVSYTSSVVGIGSSTLFIPIGATFTANSTGTFVGTAMLMRSLDGSNFSEDPSNTTWTGTPTVSSTATITVNTPAHVGAYYRIDTTAYTSGTISVLISQTNNYLRSSFNTYGNSIKDEYDSGTDFPNGSVLGVSNDVNFGKPPVLPFKTLAQLGALTPSTTGELYLCSNCTIANSIVLSTGNQTPGEFSIIVTSFFSTSQFFKI